MRPDPCLVVSKRMETFINAYNNIQLSSSNCRYHDLQAVSQVSLACRTAAGTKATISEENVLARTFAP